MKLLTQRFEARTGLWWAPISNQESHHKWIGSR